MKFLCLLFGHKWYPMTYLDLVTTDKANEFDASFPNVPTGVVCLRCGEDKNYSKNFG